MSTDSNGGDVHLGLVRIGVYCKVCHKTHVVRLDEEPCGGLRSSWIEESTGLDWTQVLRMHVGEFSGA